MSQPDPSTVAPPPLRAQRVAELVADTLRSRILGPDVSDGDALPKEDDLRREFGVGKPAIREALRILESEGLLTIKRGNQGGPIARKPRADNIAYTIGLALASQGVHSSDVGEAIRLLEPACAMACALRTDRATEVVPALDAIVTESRDPTLTASEVSQYSRQFHEELVRRCGNETLSMVAGALEHLWSRHVASATTSATAAPRSDKVSSVDEHARIVELIADGDAIGVLHAVSEHLDRVQRSGSTSRADVPIAVSVLNSRLRP